MAVKPETKILAEFPKCPDCGSEETVAQKALTDNKLDSEGTIAHLEVTVVPLKQPAMAGVMVPAIVVHWDVCLGCGRRRCTLAEVQQVPVMAPPGMSPSKMGFPRARG